MVRAYFFLVKAGSGGGVPLGGFVYFSSEAVRLFLFFFFLITRPPPRSPLFPSPPLSRSPCRPAAVRVPRHHRVRQGQRLLPHRRRVDQGRPRHVDRGAGQGPVRLRAVQHHPALGVDRKSTRLNSSHSQISYAVFCLKKKK